MEPYAHLSRIYDQGWSRVPAGYATLVEEKLDQRRIQKARILDLACGTGDLALSLAKKNHVVLGIDKSPPMIAEAKRKGKGAANPEFQVQDMARFSVPGKFDLITCTFDSLNYLVDTADILSMFRGVNSVLSESGIFIFDFNTDHLFQEHHRGTLARTVGDESFVQELRYDANARVATTVFRFSNGDVERHRQRAYDLRDLRPILSSEGLVAAETYSDLKGTPLTSGSERVICVAERKRQGPALKPHP